jgi:hypothetical protein
MRIWVVVVSLVAATFAGCGPQHPRLQRGDHAGARYEIEESEESLIENSVYLIKRKGYWFAGSTEQTYPLAIFDLENRSDRTMCAVVYYRIEEGYIASRWGNGEPVLLAPGQAVREAAGIVASEDMAYLSKASARIWFDGHCNMFPSPDQMFEEEEE